LFSSKPTKESAIGASHYKKHVFDLIFRVRQIH